jgi:PAS domain S-box-containing protein
MEQSLRRLSLVDSPPTEDFDRFTRLVTKALGVPVALVCVIDAANNRQFFTSACGLNEPWASQRQTPLSHSFCKHVVASGKPLMVEDARDHPLVRDNPAIDDLNITAYLGFPVTLPDGEILGTLSAIDHQPRQWSGDDLSVLADLAASVTSQIRLRAAVLISESTRKAANRFGRIIENSHHEVFTFDPDTLLFANVNKGARDNLGYTLDEIRQLTPVDIKPCFEWSEFERFVKPLKDGETSELEFETHHERKNGTRYPVSIRLEHHHDAGGAVFIAFCIDITERRHLEHALLEESENFSALFNHVNEPMAILEPDTTILLANPACSDLFGHPIEDLVGTRFAYHFSKNTQIEIMRNLATATPQNPSFSFVQEQELNGQRKTMIWSNITHFVNGKATKISLIANDVTELNAAKVRAEESAAEAKKAIEIRKVFLANMSHEVRTPLNAIMGLFQLIQMADVPERQKKQAQVGLDASHHLLSQLVNVLELSRVEANAVEIAPKMTEIRPLAEQWLETAIATNHRLGKPIKMSLDIAENTPELFNLDPRRVTQIINNLTDNALKFTKSGRVDIHVRQGSQSGASQNAPLEITVSDTGCGIVVEKRAAIFERFVQVDDAQTRENSGSGLGLAISRELAELMGASLDVTCPSPQGCYATIFSLRLKTVEYSR